MSSMKIDIGYILINRIPVTDSAALIENNFVLNLTYLVTGTEK
jgi:hypothetical protein